MPAGRKRFSETDDRRRVEHQFLVAPAPRTRRHAHVVAAVVQDRGGKRRELVPVAQPQQRHDREMRARGLAADREARRAEALGAFAHEPQRRRFAIVRTGRIRMLRRKPVVERYAGEPAIVGEALQHRVELIVGADRPAAAVDMEKHAARGFRRDHAQLELAARSVDADRLGARRFRRQRKCAEPLEAPRADLRNRQPDGLGIEPRDDLVVELPGFRRDRGRVEQRGVDGDG